MIPCSVLRTSILEEELAGERELNMFVFVPQKLNGVMILHSGKCFIIVHAVEKHCESILLRFKCGI